jgi:nuclear pore complex protein Nup62
MISPLEKDLARIAQPIDVERSQTYLMAETLDSQLKQMSEELKEVIEHLNEANKFADSTDPMTTMIKILNAHFSSLQWVEDKSQTISNRIEVLNKLSSNFRNNKSSQFRYD